MIRKTISALIAMSLIAGASCKKTSSSDVNLNSGLLAYYPFSGNANDAGPNKLNGTINGGVTFTSDVSGKANSAVAFDGSTGFISVSDMTGILSPTIVSISLQVNFTNITVRSIMVNKIEYDNASGLSYSVGIPLNNDNQFAFATVQSGYDCSNGVYQSEGMYNSSAILPNKWYHIVAVFSGTTKKIYVNGVLTTTATTTFSSLNQCTNATSFLMGGWWQNDIVSLNGSLDEVRIYNRELNQDEITQLAKPVTGQ